MAQTYTAISTSTLSATATDVTFSSIPSTYTDLVVVVKATNTGGNTDLFLRLNSDTATNYSYIYLTSSGSGYTYSQFKTTANARMGYYALPQSTVEYFSVTQIMNYANTSMYKSWITRANAASVGVDYIYGLWRDTSAINTVMVRASSGNFGIGSIFTLYGIKAA